MLIFCFLSFILAAVFTSASSLDYSTGPPESLIFQIPAEVQQIVFYLSIFELKILACVSKEADWLVTLFLRNASALEIGASCALRLIESLPRDGPVSTALLKLERRLVIDRIKVSSNLLSYPNGRRRIAKISWTRWSSVS